MQRLTVGSRVSDLKRSARKASKLTGRELVGGALVVVRELLGGALVVVRELERAAFAAHRALARMATGGRRTLPDATGWMPRESCPMRPSSDEVTSTLWVNRNHVQRFDAAAECRIVPTPHSSLEFVLRGAAA